MARKITEIEEVRALIGTDLDPGPWLTVDQERVDRFAEATGDHQWIHVDPERAAAGPYGGTIAHGYLTLSLVPGLALQVYELAVGSARVNYGVDAVRFPQPVPVGGRVRLAACFLELAERGGSHRLRTRFTIEIEGRDKPACVAEGITLLLP